MAQLTEYELERLANIERNQAILQTLGIFQPEVGPSKAKKEAEDRAAAARERRQRRQQAQKTSKKWDPLETPPPATRRSSRLSVPTTRSMRQSRRENLNSDPIDFLSQPASSPFKRRTPVRLRPRPSTPARRPVYVESSSDEDTKKDTYEYEDDEHSEVELPRQPLPTRDENGNLYFHDEPGFVPNMTPEEMLREGSFGGAAFGPHRSLITDRMLPESDYAEFPESWFEGLDINRYVTSDEYDPLVNRYGVKAGQSLSDWEKHGWIHSQDPRGWFQWYCRFYLGRRTRDDGRQMKRWSGVCGPVGRFKKSLIKKIAAGNGQWDDEKISPVVRQTLQHWGYRLTKEDYEAYLYINEEEEEK